MEKPVIGITMGDPAGIGPEIVVKALSRPRIYKVCRPVVIGDLLMLRHNVCQLKLDLKLKPIKLPRNSEAKRGTIETIDLKNVSLKTLQIGKVSEDAGKASVEYIEKAVEYAMDGILDAIATAPINKESIHKAGIPHIGHTELLEALTGSEKSMTMFWVRDVRIFFLTRHLPLRKAIEEIKKSKIVNAAKKINEFLQKMGIENPCIAVAALNPHSGDGGLIGEEEKKEILPAIKTLQKRGLNMVGPIPADSIFYQAFQGKYDSVLSLYHDQGHIAAKTADFYGTITVTLGLPFIRTSVDHGTAFNIAGKGIANSKSLEKSIEIAAKLTTKNRLKNYRDFT